MGLAIIAFSVFLRLILTPLTSPYMESVKKMKEIAPQIEKLKKKYKDDKMKFAQAQADVYKQNGINPGAGCLPYILQIVVLIAFFNVFSRTINGNGNVTEQINNLLYPFLRLGAGESLNTGFLYLNLTKPDVFHIPGLSFPLPGPILILAALLQFVSAKMMEPVINKEKKVAEKAKDSTDDMQVAMQSSMTYTFPLFTLIFGMQFTSALALYWLTFSAWQVWQQYKTSGWGALTPLFRRLGLLKSVPENEK